MTQLERITEMERRLDASAAALRTLSEALEQYRASDLFGVNVLPQAAQMVSARFRYRSCLFCLAVPIAQQALLQYFLERTRV